MDDKLHNTPDSAPAPDLADRLVDALAARKISTNRPEALDFIDWMLKRSWADYQKDCMDIRIIIMNRINGLDIAIANGTKGKPYASAPIKLPTDIAFDYQFEGLEEIGLKAVPGEEEGTFTIEGTPSCAGDFTIVLKYKYDGWLEGRDLLERRIPFAVNADPREIMEQSQKPTPTDIPYFKPDRVCEYVKVEAAPDGSPRKDMVAASVRGRSHGREGRPRDDHFQISYDPSSEWYVMAVADGAGSAKYSRKGSEVACTTAVDYCREKLSSNGDFKAIFEAMIAFYHTATDEAAARKTLGNGIYQIVGNAAFQAHKAITEVSKLMPDSRQRDFATTLMLAICKKFDFGWFIATFWVGDGAMGIYDKEKQTFRLLGVPDEGEFSGQTRFLTMPEIFSDYTALYKRLRFGFFDDFTALMLMTDGVSDPMFGTDTNLNSIDCWNDFWTRLQTGFPADGIGGVDLSDDNEAAKDQLMRWLDFWMRGEHDDRTIAILY